MWVGHLGQVNVAKHRIGFTNEKVHPIHSVLYRARPKAREFEKAEINKMLCRESPNQLRQNGLRR